MSKTLSYDGSLRYWANHTQQLDIKREGEREEGREGGREEGGRRRWKDLNAGYRSIQELLVYPMPSTAHFALYIDMNMSG